MDAVSHPHYPVWNCLFFVYAQLPSSLTIISVVSEEVLDPSPRRRSDHDER